MSDWPIESVQGFRLLSRTPLPGGPGMQLMERDGYLYMGHLAPEQGTTVVDVHDPSRPRVVGALPAFAGTYCTKVQIVEDLLFVNYEQKEDPARAERTGFGIFDLSHPAQPRQLAYVNTGGRGVHRMWCTGERLYLSAVPDGFAHRMLLIYDVSDPAHPHELGRWWIPGLWTAGGERPRWPAGLRYNLHHPVVHADRAYLGCWDAGFKILNVRDAAHPEVVGEVGGWCPQEGGCTHTAMPLPERELAILTDESTRPNCQEPPKRVRLVDIRDETRPRVIAVIPPPDGDFCNRGGRFGPHNLHEHRPGAFQSGRTIFVTYYAGGLRAYNVDDPAQPREVGHFLPAPPPGQSCIQINDIYISASGLVYLSDRGQGGLFLLQLEERLPWR